MLTVDQRHSRRTRDRVDTLLRDLAGRADLLRPFERTAGDEVQGIADRPDVAVELTLMLVRDQVWSVGLGVGPVDQPLPDSTRAGSGPAFVRARAAVTAAKTRSTGLAVVGADDDGGAARRAQTALDLVASLLQRRTIRGAEAVALAREGLNQLEVAGRLGVSKQAVSQRLQAADWHLEVPGRELATHLLSTAAGTVGGS